MEVYERGEEFTRDLFIFEQYIHNIVGRLAIETYKRDNNDAKYVRMWVQENSFLVFLLQRIGCPHLRSYHMGQYSVHNRHPNILATRYDVQARAQKNRFH
jgi:hypothetical protein